MPVQSPINDYTDLVARQKAYARPLVVYQATRFFPEDERFGLVSQMRRAAISIPSNIAEGWGRGATADYERFLRIARGSAYELQTQARLALDLEYLTADQSLHEQLREVIRVLNGLIKSLHKSP